MRLRCPVRQHILGQLLTAEWFDTRYIGLGLSGDLTRNIALQRRALLNRKQRPSVRPVEHEQETLLADLCHRIHLPAVVLYGQQHWVSGKVTIPYVVVDTLKVPNEFPCARA